MDFASIGRTLLVVALVLFLIGLLMIGLGRLGFGRLPGDITFEHGHTKVYLPLASSILISIILSLLLSFILWLISRGR